MPASQRSNIGELKRTSSAMLRNALVVTKGYVYRRIMLVRWQKEWCVLRGGCLLFYPSEHAAAAHANPSKVFVMHQIRCSFTGSRQRFKIANNQGKCCRFRVAAAERQDWARALSSALLVKRTSIQYGNDIGNQLLQLYRKSDAVDRRGSISQKLSQRFDTLIEKDILVKEFVLNGISFPMQRMWVDKQEQSLTLHSSTQSPIMLSEISAVREKLKLTRLGIISEAGIAEIEVTSAAIRSLLVFGLSRTAPNVSIVESPTSTRELWDSTIRRFNVNPIKGIHQALDLGLIETASPNHVALYLRYTKGLDKDRIGEYLGFEDAFCVQVLSAFAESFDMDTKSFEECLRHFLATFRLPGESQKIDRIMEAFAIAFHTSNSTIFRGVDTAHILAFSTLMLNTDAHNPSIPKTQRMTKADFIRNHRGMDAGCDIPPRILEEIYDSITACEIQTLRDRDDNGNLFSDAEMCGWLKELSGSRFIHRAQWFMLSNHCLYYFDNQCAIDPIGFVPLEDIVVEQEAGHPRRILLRSSKGLFLKSARYAASTPRSDRNIILRAQDAKECHNWIQALRQSVVYTNARLSTATTVDCSPRGSFNSASMA